MASKIPPLFSRADPANNEGSQKRSQLPQLTPRSTKTTSHIPSPSLPVSSPIRPKVKQYVAAMPPPSTSLARTQSTRTRALPQPSSSTASATKSTIAPPSRSLSTKTPAPSSSSHTVPKPRVVSHSRNPSASAAPPSTTKDSALKRSATVTATSGHLRSRSTVTVATKPTPTLERARPDPVKPSIRRTARAGTTSAITGLDGVESRPAFNTLQQHYSPAKTTLPKPPVPSSRPAPSVEDKAIHSGAAFDTTKQQSELLYLSLLHETAKPNLRRYEKSARKALKQEFEAIQDEVKHIRGEEQLVQEQGNLTAIVDWLNVLKGNDTHFSQEAAETIQCLSGCMNELMMLSAPESKYSTLVHDFSQWATEATEQDRAHIFSGPLPQDWHQLHASISQRVRLVEREVEMLPPVPHQSDDEDLESSLEIVLRCINSLVMGMKEELIAMVQLERQVISTEKQRVKSAVAGLSLNILLRDDKEWTPAWQSSVF